MKIAMREFFSFLAPQLFYIVRGKFSKIIEIEIKVWGEVKKAILIKFFNGEMSQT